jgi:transcriptional regulator with XRE-family HTH domain
MNIVIKAERVRLLRESKKMSQAALANATRLPFVRVAVIASRRVERVRCEQALFFDGLPAREFRGVLSRTCLAHRGCLSPNRANRLALAEPQRKHVPDAELALHAAGLMAFTPNPIPEFFG